MVTHLSGNSPLSGESIVEPDEEFYLIDLLDVSHTKARVLKDARAQAEKEAAMKRRRPR